MHVRRRVPKCKCRAPVTQEVVGLSPISVATQTRIA
jgi:hypothetical protein